MRKVLKSGKKIRRLSRFGYDAAGKVIGVKRVPDAIDAAEWTYNSVKDPSKIPQRTQKLVNDAGKTVVNVGNTITNPNKMAKNAKRNINSIGKTVGKLFK
jgi:hypothetical protein